MTKAIKILESLMEEGNSARAHYQTWWALRNLALPTYYSAMSESRYVDFFQLSSAGHYKLFFLALSKIFDRDGRAAGLSHLRQSLRAEGFGSFAAILEREISPHLSLVGRMMGIRNKAIVHNEIEISREQVYESNGVTPDEIRDLIDLTCNSLNDCARGLGLTNTIFESKRHESAVLELLKTLQRGRE